MKINGVEYPTVTVNGVERFPGNPIIREVLDAASEGRKYNLNEIWRNHQNGLFTLDQMREFYRLIGYSVCGFGEVFKGPETLLDDEKAEDFKDEAEERDRGS